MRQLLPRFFLALFGFSLLAAVAAGPQLEHDLERLHSEWQALEAAPVTTGERLAALEGLAARADRIAARHPDRLEPQLWEGLIAGSRAVLASARSEGAEPQLAAAAPAGGREG